MAKKRIYLASDHSGFKLKKTLKAFLSTQNCSVIDLGPYQYKQKDDYPDYALLLCNEVLKTQSKGILICGSGLGMSRAANKIPGIYANVCWSQKSARLARAHGNTNVLCLGEQMITRKQAKIITRVWLATRLSQAQRHKRRINKIKKIEREV